MQNKVLTILTLLLFSFIYAQQTGNENGLVNLNNHSNPNPPNGSVFQWHSNFPLTQDNLLTNEQASAVPAGTYYAVFYDTAKDCYSPATSLKVKNNSCPSITVNLNSFTQGITIPEGATLEWHSSNTPNPSTRINNTTSVSDGTYYAVFYDSINGCYSPVTPVIISSIYCDPYCFIPAATNGPILNTNVGISTIGQPNGWPQNRTGAQLVLESESKGFVLNRLTTLQINAIETPVEGMIAYDIDVNCLKIYSKNVDNTFTWKCFNVQSCPN